MDAELIRLVEERLTDSGYQNTEWALLVLAACEGPDSLDAVLGGQTKRRRPRSAAQRTTAAQEPPGAYLRSITVEGFRGVGPTKTLELTPGPGLTLVIGRNGSGKSSFAEALEILLTGSNWRWEYRSLVWKEGWCNLHHPSRAQVSAEFAVETEKGATTITRTWADNAVLDSSTLAVSMPSKRARDLAELGWTSKPEEYRRFSPTASSARCSRARPSFTTASPRSSAWATSTSRPRRWQTPDCTEILRLHDALGASEAIRSIRT